MRELDFRGWLGRDELSEGWAGNTARGLLAALAMTLAGCGGKPNDTEKAEIRQLAVRVAAIGPNGRAEAEKLLKKHGIDPAEVLGQKPAAPQPVAAQLSTNPPPPAETAEPWANLKVVRTSPHSHAPQHDYEPAGASDGQAINRAVRVAREGLLAAGVPSSRIGDAHAYAPNVLGNGAESAAFRARGAAAEELGNESNIKACRTVFSVKAGKQTLAVVVYEVDPAEAVRPKAPTVRPKPPQAPSDNRKDFPVRGEVMNLDRVVQRKVSLVGRAYRHEYILAGPEHLSNTVERAAEAVRVKLRAKYQDEEVGDAFGMGRTPQEAAAKALERAQVQEENRVGDWESAYIHRGLGDRFVAVIVYGRVPFRTNNTR